MQRRGWTCSLPATRHSVTSPHGEGKRRLGNILNNEHLSQALPVLPTSVPCQKHMVMKLCRENSCKLATATIGPPGEGTQESWQRGGEEHLMISSQVQGAPLRKDSEPYKHISSGGQVTAAQGQWGMSVLAHWFSVTPARNPHTDLCVPDNPQSSPAAARSLPRPGGAHSVRDSHGELSFVTAWWGRGTAWLVNLAPTIPDPAGVELHSFPRSHPPQLATL